MVTPHSFFSKFAVTQLRLNNRLHHSVGIADNTGIFLASYLNLG